MEIDNTLIKVLGTDKDENGLSVEEKLEIVRDLVSNDVASILKKQIIISKTIKKKVFLKLNSKAIENSNNIHTFLEIFGAKNIQINGGGEDYSTDYTGGRDYFPVPTNVEFKI